MNQREAAVRLLLPFVEQKPPFSLNRKVVSRFRETMDNLSTADLEIVVVDPRANVDQRAVAYQVLVDRGGLKPKGINGANSAFGSDLGSLLNLLQTRI